MLISPKMKQRINRTIFMVLFLLPAMLFLGIFLYYPIEETFRLSFTNTSTTHVGLNEQYIGLRNYIQLFKNEEFLYGLWHVFAWAFWSIVIQIPLAFAVAFSLTFYKNKLTGPLRSIYYLANVLPTAITAMLGLFVFSPNNGIITKAAEAWGLTWISSLDFYGDPSLAFWTVFTVATWAYTGFPIILLMANIEQIPTEIRDAAELDGVTGWSYAWYIVRPMVGYTIRILVVLCTVGSIKLFDLPYLLTSGGPGDATKTLGIILYLRGFVDGEYGRAAAVGVIIFLLSLIFAILQFSIGAKRGQADEAA
jgi:raffinose/stachyose/melibiose transport system permease protein